jgi:hypothetical protein
MQPPNPAQWNWELMTLWAFAIYGFLCSVVRFGSSYRRRQHTEVWQTLHANQDPEPARSRRRRAHQEASTN